MFRLPARGGADGVTRCRGGVLQRLIHVDGEPVVVRVAQPGRERVLFGAKARDEAKAETAIRRMRFALSVDDDLSEFHDRFRDDPLIGSSVRSRPHLRCARRPDPFEALAWAICEQLIDFPRAAAIERRIVRRLGRRCARSGLLDLPDAERLSRTSPAMLQSMDLSHGRALALTKVAREVASGRADLADPDHESAWRRLRKIPGIGSWTLSVLAQQGQGRYDVMLAGDLGFIKLVGRLLNDGDPYARATEQQVLDHFARFGEWKGLASVHALRAV
jgi:3-methyladenine DNA glycosylase/8-oxoguanine DNA glycosylase